MTRKQQEALLVKAARLQSEMDDIDRVIMEIATAGTSSASLSSGGGSKSYTRLDIEKLKTLKSCKISELQSVRAILSGSGPQMFRTIQFVRS